MLREKAKIEGRGEGKGRNVFGARPVAAGPRGRSAKLPENAQGQTIIICSDLGTKREETFWDEGWVEGVIFSLSDCTYNWE